MWFLIHYLDECVGLVECVFPKQWQMRSWYSVSDTHSSYPAILQSRVSCHATDTLVHTQLLPEGLRCVVLGVVECVL